jgi:lipid-binding SYLF domain-containing protein
MIATRYSANEEYYEKPVYPVDILSGNVKPPASAQKLLDLLAKY